MSLHETLTEVVRTGQPAKRNLQIPASSRSFELQAAPLVSGDKPGAIAILHDITDLERLENVRKDFVANVSHEFRTPLAAIAGYAETLLDGALEDQNNNRRFLEIIRSNANRLNNIASDLLTLSELQSGSGPVQRRTGSHRRRDRKRAFHHRVGGRAAQCDRSTAVPWKTCW